MRAPRARSPLANLRGQCARAWLAVRERAAGALTIGGLSEHLGVRLALGVLAGLCGLGTVATWCYVRYRLGRDLLADG